MVFPVSFKQVIEQDSEDWMDWRDGLEDFKQSYSSLKSPQIIEQDSEDWMDWRDGLEDFKQSY
jgi:hypothetical protein